MSGPTDGSPSRGAREGRDEPDLAVFGDGSLRPWAGRRPAQLLRAFTIGSALGIVVLLLLVGVGVHRMYDHHIVRQAEVNTVELGRAVLAEEGLVTTTGLPGARTLAVAPERMGDLDAWMQRLPHPGLVKVKLFSREGRIVYSTDHGVVGRVDHDNVQLRRALAGETWSGLEPRGRAWDVEGERTFDADIVETYVPIRAGAEVAGIVETYTDVTWSRAEGRRVVALALVAALVVLLAVFGALYVLMRTLTRDLARAQLDLEQMAITDALTGLANRRYLLGRAEQECARLARLGDKGVVSGGVGFIMADIDQFKLVNDTHGHLAGDGVLREVAARVRRVTRRYDVVGRYGGDEFLVVLPQADPDETRAVAERVWLTVRERPFAVGEGATRLTISVGIACATPGDHDFTTVLKRADEALYVAKDGGRDRVAWA